jgi:alpha-ketoglutarate-dependent taurine dioxygenase
MMATTTTSETKPSNQSIKLDHSLGLSLEPFHLPASNQRTLSAPHPCNIAIPLALRLSNVTEVNMEIINRCIKILQKQDGIFTKKLALHGALLFRGLPINNSEDFSNFAHAFGYRPHEVIGSIAKRPLLAPNVSLANEAPKEVLIYNHNELPRLPYSPAYVFFFGEETAKRGGETSISSSLELFNRAQQEIPKFIEELARKGILSTITYKVNKQFEGGTTLKEAFGKEFEDHDDEITQRRKIEEQIKRYGRGENTTWRWIDDGLIVTHRLSAIRTQPKTNLPTLFTGLAAYYKSDQLQKDADRRVTQMYGDGTTIPDHFLAHLAQITDQIRVLHKWEQGDVLVFDNIIAQHGREPWEGEQSDRVVLASLFDGDNLPGGYGPEDWAQVVPIVDE